MRSGWRGSLGGGRVRESRRDAIKREYRDRLVGFEYANPVNQAQDLVGIRPPEIRLPAFSEFLAAGLPSPQQVNGPVPHHRVRAQACGGVQYHQLLFASS